MGKKGLLPNSAKRACAAATEDALLETRAELPTDPDDPRLTLDGAVVDAKGKIDVGAYADLQSWYAGEPPPTRHPRPTCPGVRLGEDVTKGMRNWDDVRAGCEEKTGAGWIAARSARKGEPKREKWFNIRTTGSWRLAFLLARLQLDLWERQGGPGFNQRKPAAASSSMGSQPVPRDAVPPSGDQKEEEEEEEEKLEVSPPSDVSTPQKLRPPTASPKVSPAAPASRKRPRPAAQQQQQPPQKKSALGADVLGGSVRLQQILAARRAQEEAAAEAAAAETRR